MRLILLLSAALAPLALQPASNTDLQVRRVVEELRIVSNDSAVATSLTSIAAGMMLEDGRFVTVHSREGVLRIFDAAGRLIRLVGGKGDGPGEFRGPNGFGTFDSTIWVRDILAQRYVLFNHRFEPLGSLRLPRTQAGVLVLGVGVGQVGVFLDQADTTALYVHDAGGETTRRFDMPLRSVAHRFSVRDAQSQGGSRVTQSPLGSYSTAMLIPGGTEVLLLEPSLVWGGRAGQISLRRLSLATGQLSDRTIVSLVPQPVSRSERDSVVADWIEVQKYSPAVAREFRAGTRTPEFFPEFRTARLIGARHLLLSHYSAPGQYSIVSLDGDSVIRISLPVGSWVLATDGLRLWTSLPDSLGVPSILRYRIQ